MWNCPVCAAQNSTMICDCGFDKSRDYESFPTFGMLPAGIPSASGLMDDPEPRMAVVKCPECGLEAVIYEDQFQPKCSKCGTLLNPTDYFHFLYQQISNTLDSNDLRERILQMINHCDYLISTSEKALSVIRYGSFSNVYNLKEILSKISVFTVNHDFELILGDINPIFSKITKAYEANDYGQDIFDVYEAQSHALLTKCRDFLRSAGFRRYRGEWHFTVFRQEEYLRLRQSQRMQNAAAAFENGDWTLARQLWETAAQEGNPYAYAHLGMLCHYGNCTRWEPDRESALQFFHKGAAKGCPLSAAWISEYIRMGYAAEKDKQLGETLYAAVDPELQKMCEAGDANAQYFRAFGLLRGIGIPEDKPEGIRLLQAAHAQAHRSATVELASCYYYGDGVELDYDMAFRLLNERACPGNKTAPYLLGLCYYWGNGTEQDYSRAFAQFQRAATLGHGTAKDYLGDCYSLGRGTEVNYAEAAKWYHDAADNHKNSNAAHSLAFLYNNGQGVEKNVETAVRYWMIAAEDGIVQAQRIISNEYLTGDILEKDNEAAREWMEKAAKQGDAQAQYMLGRYYLSDLGFDDDEKAIAWLRKSADQNYAPAQEAIGNSYLYGFQTDENPAEAARWFRLAAEQGEGSAMHSLACLYLDGKGVVRDPDTGLEYLIKASDGGFRAASLELADRYYLGIPDYRGQALYTNPSLAHKYAMLAAEDETDGKAQYRMGTIIHHALGNPAGAKDWYRRAIANGSAEARLGLCKTLIGLQENLEEAWKLLQELEDEAEVLYWRSVCLENGWGCARNKRLAKEFYNKAIAKGYVDTAKKKKRFGFF